MVFFFDAAADSVASRDSTLFNARPDAVFRSDSSGFFPFVEPGFELDISCLICCGEGCPSCKHSCWLELCPCGMIHPNVLREGGIDPDEYTGFAFGLGLTRLAMMKYVITV